MKILIDAFGGDNSPEQIIAGSIDAVNERTDFTAVLVGDEQIIKDQLKNYQYPQERVEIINAPEIITCEEEPTVAIRKKPDSSICVAFKNLKENDEYDAFVSAGSTGAVLVGATLKLGRIRGVNRPALAPVLPTCVNDKQVIVLDAGANADCKSVNLLQFAVMGSVYAQALGVKNPKIALLSNGTEDEKGNALNHEVFPLLKQLEGIDFMGNCEARDILSGEYDVVVTDGFSGNVAIKSIEGAVKLVLGALKDCIYGSTRGKIGGMFLKKPIGKMRNHLDYTKRGGAIFLGASKPVIKAHGSSKRESFKIAVLQACNFAGFDISNKIAEKLPLVDKVLQGEQ